NGIADTIDKRSEEIGRAGGRLAASLIKGIVNGIRAGNEESAKAMTEVADSIWASFKSFFGIHSPSTLMEEGGGNIMDGLELGIFGGKIDVENSAFQVGEGVETGVMDGASGLPTSMDEMMSGLSGNMSLDGFNVGETAGKGVTDGLNSTEGGLYDSGFNLGTAATDGFIDGFNLEFVGPMPSLPDIKKIISGYQSYSKTREAQHKKDVEQFNEEEYLKKKSASSMGQVAGAEKNAADIRAETQKKEFNAFVSWMDKRKKYGKLSLTEEMKLWAKLANTYADNAELETQATDKLYELEQRRLTRRKEISEEIRKSVKDFNESFADRTKSIYDSSRVQAKEVMSELDQLKAIDSQINSINDLKTEIDDLAKRRRELSKEELTATERDREQEKIDRRLVIAKKELKMAEKDLADTRKTAGYSAAQLQIEADKEALQSLKDQYRGRKALMEKGFSEEQISDMSKEQMAAMAKATDAELSEYHKIWDESQKYARLIAANELKGTRQEVLDNISKLHEEYKSLNIGKTFVQELYNGMHEEAPSITKLGTETGKFLGSGMASGLKSMSGALNSAGKEISEEAVEGVKASLKLTGKITEQDMNLAPTITPVVDMTEVDKGIANSFGHKKLGIASSADKAARATATDGNSGVINNNYRTENNDNRVTVQITNNNYVRNKDDIDKISKGLEKVVTKYNRSKGVKVS
ncbi:MAG: hypothetical protein LBR74_09420, partial [Eubacterium sp.]|nr:hypothetical protein [Eubacterium sp.]